MVTYKRFCPICSKEVTHKNHISYNASLKKNKSCSKCSNIERANRPEEKEKNSLRQKGKRKGKNNPFYGKKHTEETKKKIKEKRRTQIIPKGIKNKLYGKKINEILGDDRAIILKKNKSIKFTGKGNPMYGKPSPKGSGNGWSGWYNGWFFRSLLELSYMINIIERYNLKWVSGENRKYKIKYVDSKNVERNYFPDFIIEDKYMVELKPKKLMKTDNVVRKKIVGELFCVENNLKYKLTNIPILSDHDISNLIENKKVILIDKYQKIYEQKYKNS